MIFSVVLYLVLLPSYHAQHYFAILWRLVLDINVPLSSLLPCPLLYAFLHIFINTTFKHVTSTFYHSWYLVYAFVFSVSNTKYHILCSGFLGGEVRRRDEWKCDESIMQIIILINHFTWNVNNTTLAFQAMKRHNPTATYGWTVWVREITGWSSRLQINYPSF